MKVIWEADDIQAGRRYGKRDVAERWMIGYKSGTYGFSRIWFSVSLADGMITAGKLAIELAASLSQDGYLPEELLK